MIKPLIFTVIDTNFEQYAKAMENSAKAHGMDVLVHRTGETAKGSTEKAYHSALRFVMLPELLVKHEAVLLLDADSIITKPIEFEDEYDLGIFLRLHKMSDEMKVLACALYVKNTALEWAIDLSSRINRRDIRNLAWCQDQGDVWHTYDKFDGKYCVKVLDEDFVEWGADHPRNAPVWTGKGQRKFRTKFMSMVQELQ